MKTFVTSPNRSADGWLVHREWYKAEQWGLKMMQESGADKAWMQECMVPHWVRGGKDEAYTQSINEQGIQQWNKSLMLLHWVIQWAPARMGLTQK